MTFARASGVLLHPTCLPGRFGIGDLGPAAHGYLEWLARAGARWWQVLPLNPAGLGASPYAAPSTFAGNTALVSPELLRAEGLLEAGDLAGVPEFSPFAVEFDRVVPYKQALLERAFERFAARPPAALDERFEAFRGANGAWLRDWALFAAIRRSSGGLPWWEWPEELALRRPGALASWLASHETRGAVRGVLPVPLLLAVAGPARASARARRPHPGRPADLRRPRQRRGVGQPRAVPPRRARPAAGGRRRPAGLLQPDRPALGEPGLRLGGERSVRLGVVGRAGARRATAWSTRCASITSGGSWRTGRCRSGRRRRSTGAGSRGREAGSSPRCGGRSASCRWSRRTSA